MNETYIDGEIRHLCYTLFTMGVNPVTWKKYGFQLDVWYQCIEVKVFFKIRPGCTDDDEHNSVALPQPATPVSLFKVEDFDQRIRLNYQNVGFSKCLSQNVTFSKY